MSDRIDLEELARKVNAPVAVTAALLRSGLLGYTTEGQVPEEAIEHFKLYWTQWRSELGRRQYPTDQLPTPPGLVGGEQPLSTQTDMVIAAGADPVEAMAGDTGWLAHFYLRPNPFFFPSATEMALVGPVPVRLKRRLNTKYEGLAVTVCPDPEGRLALLVVQVPAEGETDPFDRAYEAAQAVLRNIAFAADLPLPIAHFLLIGVPSGVIRVQFPKPAREIDLESLTLPSWSSPHGELEEAKSLYWEALATSNPFHRFLSFWRIYERVKSAIHEWRKVHRRPDTKVLEERMPEMWVWESSKGKSFEKVRQELSRPYRDALAHADGKQTRPRTHLRASDVADVASSIPVVQYIARTVIRNLEATLDDIDSSIGTTSD